MIPGPFKIVTTSELGAAASSISFTDFSGIPSGSKHLVLLFNGKADTGTPAVYVRFNNDSGSNYNYEALKGATSTASAGRTDSAAQITVQSTLSSTSNIFGGGVVIVPNYANSANHKLTMSLMGNTETSVELVIGRWASTSTITRADILASANNFLAGSFAALAVMDETYVLATVEPSSGAIDVTGLSTLHEDLTAIGYLRTAQAETNRALRITFNNDTTDANYNWQRMYGSSGTAAADTDSVRAWPDTLGNSAGANEFTALVLYIQQYSNATNHPHVLGYSGYHRASTNGVVIAVSERRASATAINRITLDNSQTANFVSGTIFSVYRLTRNRTHDTNLGSDTATITAASVAGTSDAIYAQLYGRTDRASQTNDTADLELNDDTTGSNYDRQVLNGTGSTLAAAQSGSSRTLIHLPGNTATANVFGGGTFMAIKYAKTDRHKHIIGASGTPTTTSYVELISMRWENTGAITQVEHTSTNSANFKSGTQFQLEASAVPSVTTSGFFLRFL